jgi:hypothetical protein
MKKTNILVFSIAVMALLLLPLSAMANPTPTTIQLGSVGIAQNGAASCALGTCPASLTLSTTTGSLNTGSHVLPPSFSTADLFKLTWTAPASGLFVLDEPVKITFTLTTPSGGLTGSATGTAVATEVTTGGNVKDISVTWAGPVIITLPNHDRLSITLDNIAVMPGSNNWVGGTLSLVSEPAMAMLLPFGMIFVVGLRKRFPR